MNIPAWISACLTGGSLLVGLGVFIRDRNNALATQASELMVWEDSVPRDILKRDKADKYEHAINVNNQSKAFFDFVYVIPERRSVNNLVNEFEKEIVEQKFKVKKWQTSSKRREGIYAALPQGDNSRILFPGKATSVKLQLEYPPPFYMFRVYFADAHGRAWFRNLGSRNKLHQTRSAYVIHRLFSRWENEQAKKGRIEAQELNSKSIEPGA